MGSLLSMLRGSGSSSYSNNNNNNGHSGDARNVEYVEANFPEGSQVLRVGRDLLERVSAYQDGSNEVREAISHPTPENEEAAWRKIGPSVSLLRECYELAQSLERVVPGILDEFCSQGGVGDDDDPDRTDRNRGLTRLLADLMQNAFAFDALKSSIPAIQNDFSYYRRTLVRIA
ncbi:hypothetical protein IWQ56_003467, partial [Coemansia nantahalensis]